MYVRFFRSSLVNNYFSVVIRIIYCETFIFIIIIYFIDITTVQMAAQALIFFFAGFETVSNTMAFMAYELAINPDIQKRLRCEILKSRSDCSKKFTYEEIKNMKYMHMVTSGNYIL